MLLGHLKPPVFPEEDDDDDAKCHLSNGDIVSKSLGTEVGPGQSTEDWL